jgi:hypothetical protein
MSPPLVDRSTGDIIAASDHNDVKDYIEDGTYRVNTLSLNIGGTEAINSGADFVPPSSGGSDVGTSALGFGYVFMKDTANSDVYRLEVVSGVFQLTKI